MTPKEASGLNVGQVVYNHNYSHNNAWVVVETSGRLPVNIQHTAYKIRAKLYADHAVNFSITPEAAAAAHAKIPCPATMFGLRIQNQEIIRESMRRRRAGEYARITWAHQGEGIICEKKH